MRKNFDIIIVGAGSIGGPAALKFIENGFSVLVIDRQGSAGQEQNKTAIGGIRATHIEQSKIWLSQKSLTFFKNWKEQYGYSIGWREGGYLYPIYSEDMELLVKDNLKKQQAYGLNISWVDKDYLKNIAQGINETFLRGGTYSPEDGSASPIICAQSFYKESKKRGVEYRFLESVVNFKINSGKVIEVITDKDTYSSKYVINSSGISGDRIASLIKTDIKLLPDSHEAGITEPVERFLEPMIVDIRAEKGSKNYYFYQNHEGQIEFCLTPDPPIKGIDTRVTSQFLPMISKRMLQLMPKLSSLRVRRTWRGIYPNTKDGFPIIGFDKNVNNVIHAVGMCGQGFMLGPGVADLLVNMVLNDLSDRDKIILERLSIDRDFSGEEFLK